MKVLVTGGRDYDDRVFLEMTLDQIHAATPITHVIHGGASGADKLADWWAEDHGVQPVVCRALWNYWDKRGNVKRAGPERNRQMAALQPDLVVAFDGGAGTSNMIAMAHACGLKIVTPEQVGP